MNFDRIASAYRWLEYLTFGTALQRRRCEFVDHLKTVRQALILGDGDGRFTAEFVKRNESATVTLVDSSRRMLQLASSRIERYRPDLRGARLLLGDARTVPILGVYDLVATHFFLDCLSDGDIQALISRLTPSLSPNALWIVSEFRVPEHGPYRAIAKLLIKTLYMGFRLLTGLTAHELPDYSRAFRRNGFRCKRTRSTLCGILVSELWELQA